MLRFAPWLSSLSVLLGLLSGFRPTRAWPTPPDTVRGQARFTRLVSAGLCAKLTEENRKSPLADSEDVTRSREKRRQMGEKLPCSWPKTARLTSCESGWTTSTARARNSPNLPDQLDPPARPKSAAFVRGKAPARKR